MTSFVERLTEFLCDDEQVDTAKVYAELKEEGVDVDVFMQQIYQTIRTANQSQLRETAAAERDVATVLADELSRKVLKFPVDRVREIVSQAEHGIFGSVGKELAIACRNKKDTELTEKELRALAEDILSAAGNQEL